MWNNAYNPPYVLKHNDLIATPSHSHSYSHFKWIRFWHGYLRRIQNGSSAIRAPDFCHHFISIVAVNALNGTSIHSPALTNGNFVLFTLFLLSIKYKIDLRSLRCIDESSFVAYNQFCSSMQLWNGMIRRTIYVANQMETENQMCKRTLTKQQIIYDENCMVSKINADRKLFHWWTVLFLCFCFLSVASRTQCYERRALIILQFDCVSICVPQRRAFESLANQNWIGNSYGLSKTINSYFQFYWKFAKVRFTFSI